MFPNQYVKTSVFNKNLIKGINWTSLLDGTQKTLGIINQAIPIIYQVKPIINNAKTVFKIANEINTPSISNSTNVKKQEISSNKPIFYI